MQFSNGWLGMNKYIDPVESKTYTFSYPSGHEVKIADIVLQKPRIVFIASCMDDGLLKEEWFRTLGLFSRHRAFVITKEPVENFDLGHGTWAWGRLIWLLVHEKEDIGTAVKDLNSMIEIEHRDWEERWEVSGESTVKVR